MMTRAAEADVKFFPPVRISYVFLTCYLAFSSIVFITTKAEQECGDFYGIGSSLSGNLYSPNYPNQYETYVKCIWLIEADANYRVRVNVWFTGERYNGQCADYVEIRDGNSTANLQAQLCDTHSNVQYTSLYRWMWIMFKSDGIDGAGTALRISFEPFRNTTAPEITREAAPNCRSFQFECRNKQCLSMSYRCDGYNDCGCLENCDEDGCGALDLSSKREKEHLFSGKGFQMTISVSVGVITFIVICAVTIIFEGKAKWLQSKKEEKMLRDQKDHRRRRASKAFSKFVMDNKDAITTAASNGNMNFNNPTTASSNLSHNKVVPALKVTELET